MGKRAVLRPTITAVASAALARSGDAVAQRFGAEERAGVLGGGRQVRVVRFVVLSGDFAAAWC